MQASATAGHYNGQQQQQQPDLPSYAEAMRTAAPPNFSTPYPPTDPNASYHPTAPIYGPQAMPLPAQYLTQPNYTQMPVTLPTYTTNAYPQYGQTASDLEGPTTIHIIRPAPPPEDSCCRGTSGRVLGVVLGIVIIGAILRVSMNAYW